MEILNKEYIAFKKMILNDYPYELIIDDNELLPVFKHVYNSVCEQHSRINNKCFSS